MTAQELKPRFVSFVIGPDNDSWQGRGLAMDECGTIWTFAQNGEWEYFGGTQPRITDPKPSPSAACPECGGSGKMTDDFEDGQHVEAPCPNGCVDGILPVSREDAMIGCTRELHGEPCTWPGHGKYGQ